MKFTNFKKKPIKNFIRLGLVIALGLGLLTLFYFSGRSPAESYEGETKNGLPHGFGIWKHKSGSYYAGDFFEGARQGRGTWRHPDGIKYAGDWQEGEYHGRGSLFLPGGAAYHGEWQAGKKEGRGLYLWPDGSTYKGYWQNDRQEGFGHFNHPEGFSYEGQWLDGQKHGEGRGFYPDGSEYHGQWFKDMRHGTGTMLFADGSKYEGQWASDLQHGEGTLTLPDGTQETALWVKGSLKEVEAEFITLNPEHLSLVAGGEGATIKAEILPEEASGTNLNWSSSNSTVATVDEHGYVRPVSTGSAIITATTTGSNLTAFCTVTVSSTTTEVSGISLDKTSLTIRVGDTATLNAVIYPTGATNTAVTWASGSTSVVTISSATGRKASIKALSLGETFITVTSVDGKFTSRCQVTVLPKEDPATRVEVPRMIGKSVDEARRLITEAGLVVGDIRSEYHPTAPEYQVISQNPAFGATVNQGSIVNLVLSRGPDPNLEPEPDPEPEPDLDSDPDPGSDSMGNGDD